jgi:hypothetical protein
LEWPQSTYKLFYGEVSEVWYQLSDEQQDSLEAKLDEALKKVGAKTLLLCDSSWFSDQWASAGVEEFPNIKAVQKDVATLNELNWFRYVEASNVLGTKPESR